MSTSQKQLVAFLDLIGFDNYYKIIEKQKEGETKRLAAKAIGKLYRSYINRLHSCIEQAFQKLSEGMRRDPMFSPDLREAIASVHILAISDSIIVAVDCTDERIIPSFMVLTNALLSVTQETMKADYMPEELKNYGLTIFCPVRGAIAYDYSEVDLRNTIPFVYGVAYQKAYSLERPAGWPRVVIDPYLSGILVNNAFTTEALTEVNEPGGPFGSFLDVLKFQYLNVVRRLSKQADKQEAIRLMAGPYKKYIELNARHAALICQYGYESRDKLLKKYWQWAAYYNERINWLIQNDSEVAETARSLAIDEDFLENVFNNPQFGIK